MKRLKNERKKIQNLKQIKKNTDYRKLAGSLPVASIKYFFKKVSI